MNADETKRLAPEEGQEQADKIESAWARSYAQAAKESDRSLRESKAPWGLGSDRV